MITPFLVSMTRRNLFSLMRRFRKRITLVRLVRTSRTPPLRSSISPTKTANRLAGGPNSRSQSLAGPLRDALKDILQRPRQPGASESSGSSSSGAIQGDGHRHPLVREAGTTESGDSFEPTCAARRVAVFQPQSRSPQSFNFLSEPGQRRAEAMRKRRRQAAWGPHCLHDLALPRGPGKLNKLAG